MKRLALPFLFLSLTHAQDQKLIDAQGAEIVHAAVTELTEGQDDLSADAQELVELQTQAEVIEKLEEMEASMVKATLNLLDENTGNQTITIQTDIIEKAYEAAQARSQGQGEGKSDTNKAMMDQLRKMMGEQDPSRGEPSQESSSGEAPGDGSSAGEKSGKSGESEGQSPGEADFSNSSKRTVPSVSSYSGELLPEEFAELLEPYNRGE